MTWKGTVVLEAVIGEAVVVASKAGTLRRSAAWLTRAGRNREATLFPIVLRVAILVEAGAVASSAEELQRAKM